MFGELLKVFVRGAISAVGIHAGNTAIKKIKEKYSKKDNKSEEDDDRKCLDS